MDFEFDLEKSSINKAKHEIHFIEAQELWKDPNGLEVPAQSKTEPRNALIAHFSTKFGQSYSRYAKRKLESYHAGGLEMAKKEHTITAEEFDRRFDDGEDITQFLDFDQAYRPNLEQRRVNLDLPNWMIDTLDREAKRVGVTRQSIMKVWISERIKAVVMGNG